MMNWVLAFEKLSVSDLEYRQDMKHIRADIWQQNFAASSWEIISVNKHDVIRSLELSFLCNAIRLINKFDLLRLLLHSVHFGAAWKTTGRQKV
jgi:hypothetical protein